MTGLSRQNDQIGTGPIDTGQLVRWTMVLGAGALAIALLGGAYLAFQSHQSSRPPLMISTPETIGPTPATLGESIDK
jgi:hypothetical protein